MTENIIKAFNNDLINRFSDAIAKYSMIDNDVLCCLPLKWDNHESLYNYELLLASERPFKRLSNNDNDEPTLIWNNGKDLTKSQAAMLFDLFMIAVKDSIRHLNITRAFIYLDNEYPNLSEMVVGDARNSYKINCLLCCQNNEPTDSANNTTMQISHGFLQSYIQEFNKEQSEQMEQIQPEDLINKFSENVREAAYHYISSGSDRHRVYGDFLEFLTEETDERYYICAYLVDYLLNLEQDSSTDDDIYFDLINFADKTIQYPVLYKTFFDQTIDSILRLPQLGKYHNNIRHIYKNFIDLLSKEDGGFGKYQEFADNADIESKKEHPDVNIMSIHIACEKYLIRNTDIVLEQ